MGTLGENQGRKAYGSKGICLRQPSCR